MVSFFYFRKGFKQDNTDWSDFNRQGKKRGAGGRTGPTEGNRSPLTSHDYKLLTNFIISLNLSASAWLANLARSYKYYSIQVTHLIIIIIFHFSFF